jgi:hypothetical protein
MTEDNRVSLSIPSTANNDEEFDSSDEEWDSDDENMQIQFGHTNDEDTSTDSPTTTTPNKTVVVTRPSVASSEEASASTGDNTSSSSSSGSTTPRKVKARMTNSIGTIQWWTQGTKHSGSLQKKDPRGLLWKKRWFVIDETSIYYFESKDSGKSLGKIPLQDVKGVVAEKKKYCFTIQTNTGRDYLLAAENQPACDQWVEQVKQALTPFSSFVSDLKNKATRTASIISQSEEFNLCGDLKKLGEVGGWRKRYFDYSPEDHTLSYRIKKGKPPLGNIHLDRVQSVEEISKKRKGKLKKYIQLTTSNRNFILKAANEKLRQLWLETLKKEVEFIQKLNSGAQQEEEEFTTELGDQIRGTLLRKTSDGLLKKRWLYFDEVTIGLYVFVSKEAEALYIESKQVSDPYQLEQVISLEDMLEILEVTPEMARGLSIEPSESHYYFLIKCSNGEDAIFLCNSGQLKKSWVDHLIVQREANETTDRLKPSSPSSPSTAKPSSLPARKAVAELLRITDTSQKPSPDLPKQDLNALKQGTTQALYMIKGTNKQVDVTQVELTAGSLNRGHVFVLDCGGKIYQWNGRNANRLEKAKGLELTSTLKFKERGGNAHIHLIEEGEAKMDDDMKKNKQDFWVFFGGSENESSVSDSTTTTAKSDDADSDDEEDDLRMYRIANSTDLRKAVTIVQLPEYGKPHKSILNSEYVYVVDSPTEIYVWSGKYARDNQRDLGLTVAEKLLRQPNRPPWLKVTELSENAETTLWKEKFNGYGGMLPIHTGIVEKRGNVAEKQEQADIDVASLLKKDIHAAPESFVVSDKTQFTSQTVKMWRVNKFKREEYPEQLHGHFYSGDAFLVLFTWTEKSKPAAQHVLYFWQGRDASGTSKGASALLSVNLDDSLSGDTTQVRLEQSKESDFFNLLFKNRFIIHSGSYSPTPKPQSRLYDVRGTTNWNVKAVEIECDPHRLNSMHCFLLISFDGKIFLWKGSQSNNFERDAAKILAQRINPSAGVIDVNEGSEPETFFGYFPTKGKQTIKFAKPAKRHVPRIFECSEETGTFAMEEHRYITQSDLESQHCYILIPYESQESLFVWIGKTATDFVKKWSVKKAHEMLQLLNSQGITKGFAVYAGKEPLEFYHSIHGWNNLAQPNAARRTSLSSVASSSDSDAKAIPLSEAIKLYVSESVCYSYQELLRDPLPDGVDRMCLEKYLSEEEFVNIFDMPRSEFVKCQAWKQLEMKKKVYLY